MNWKVAFTDGSWRTIEADVYVTDERFVVFLKGEQSVLTASLANTLFFEPAPPEPAKTSRQDDRGGLFFGQPL